MKLVSRRFLPVLLLGLFAGGVIVACKQGEGERCQVTSDCEDGLTCNQGTNPPSCQGGTGGLPIDGSVPDVSFDSPPTDATTDATDATTDATDAN